MTVAFAADAAAKGAVHAEAFYNNTEFWVLIAFIIIVAAIGKKMFTTIAVALDRRTEAISNQIEQATKLREDALDLLASYQHKQRDAVKEADAIVGRARAEAERLAAQAAEDLEKSLKLRERQAMERISQAEAKAVKDIRAITIDLAMNATGRVLSKNITGKKADAMVHEAIRELPEKLGQHQN